MTDISIKQLAQIIEFSTEKLLEHIEAAGLHQRKEQDLISDQDKQKLILFLKKDQVTTLEKNQQAVMKGKNLSTIKTPVSGGRAKTVNVEVRKTRTFIKPTTIINKTVSVETEVSHQESTLNALCLKKLEANVPASPSSYKLNDHGQLIELNLQQSNFKDLSNFGSLDLTVLERLDLSDNNINTLTISNIALPSLNEINLKNNKILAINIINAKLNSFDVFKNIDFRNLKAIRLSGNSFSSIKFKDEMPLLNHLNISNNTKSITKVEFLQDLPKLKSIIITNSGVEFFLTPKKCLFPILEHLDLSENNISNIALPHQLFDEKRKVNINLLLENNPLPDLLNATLKKDDQEARRQALFDLFYDVIEIIRVKLIFLGNTGVGKSSIYKVLKEGERDYIHQTGESTCGVNIFRYTIKDKASSKIEVRGYDFGGQDYYHNTHYSFFGINALYILLWGAGQYIYHRSNYARRNPITNNTKNEISYPLNYWLGSVSYFCNKELSHINHQHEAESKTTDETKRNSNLILHLLQNPKEYSEELVDDIYELDILGIRKDFSFVGKNYTVPPLTEKSFENYRSIVKSKLDDLIKSYAKPVSYPKILKLVEDELIKEKDIIIDIEKIDIIFKNILEIARWEVKLNQLLEWLNITMSIYWIPPKSLENIEELTPNNKIILTENAVLDISTLTNLIHYIFELVLSQNSTSKKGYFTKKDILSGVLKTNKISKKNKTFNTLLNTKIEYIISFMIYNKIIFKAPYQSGNEDDLYIAPAYLEDSLSIAESIFLDAFDNPILEYRFDSFYHVNIFTEILVKFKYYLSHDNTKDLDNIEYLLWKNKAIFFENGQNAQKQINLPQQKPCRPLLYLEFDLGKIQDSLPKNKIIKIDDQLSLSQPCIRIRTFSKNRASISHSFLIQIMTFIEQQLLGYKYQKFALAPNKIDYVNINAMKECLKTHEGKPTGLFNYENRLYRLSDFNIFTDQKTSMKKIFISHSTSDYEELQDFIQHIYPLKRLGLIDHWHCSELVAGSEWDSEIQKNLWESDIICMLVSPSWLANDYIFEKELRNAINRKDMFKNTNKGKDIIIMPIILKPCMWNVIEWLSSLQAAPQKAKPISTFADKNYAWTDVTKKLFDILKGMDEPDYKPTIGKQLGELYAKQYEGKLDKHN